MFTRSELIAHVHDGTSVPHDLVEREQRSLDLSDCIPPFVIAGSVASAAEWPRHSTAPAQESLAIGESLTGLSGSPPAWSAGRRSWSVTHAAIRSPSRRAT